MIRKFLIIIFLALCAVPGLADSYPDGTKKTRVWDYAHLLSKSEKSRLKESVKEIGKKHGVKVWVVTINNLNRYESNDYDIGYYAQNFLADKLTEFGAEENSILFLVRKSDRKARIELGPEWGNDWDSESEHIVQNVTVPEFRKKKFGVGILATVRGLERLATKNENTSLIERKLMTWGGKIGPYSPFSAVFVLPGLALSLVLFTLGLYSKNGQGTRDPFYFKWLGLALALFTLFSGGVYAFLTSESFVDTFIIGSFAVLAVVLNNNDRGSGGFFGSSGYSGGSSFGSFGGGSSGGGFDFGGGGGATGSW